MSSELPPKPLHSSARNLQLDGWRTFAVLGVMWQHWTPDSWRGKFPFETGLYYFLCLTGFLITRILLRDRARGEAEEEQQQQQPGAKKGAWRWVFYRAFQKRRALRILIPAYVAMLFAWAVGAPDMRAHPLLYFGQVVNFHMAWMPEYPHGTAHYWTLALQQQFYLLWPLVIFLLPRHLLLPSLLSATLIGPLSRFVAHLHPELIHPAMLPPCILDFFAIGGVLAWLLENGVKAGDRRISIAAWICVIPWLALYFLDRADHPVPGLRYLQQTFCAVVFSGIVSSTLAGFTGIREKILLNPVVQEIAKLSYGLYLFHTPMPMLVGFVMPFLWPEHDGVPIMVLRLIVQGAFSWGAAWLCWRYLEQPAAKIKAKVAA